MYLHIVLQSLNSERL